MHAKTQNDASAGAIVLAQGTQQMKVGVAGSDAMPTLVRSVIGIPYRSPIHNGVVTSWDDMEMLWQKCYQTIGVEQRGRPVLVTETVNNTAKNRERSLEIMMERFEAESYYVLLEPVGVFYSSQRSTASPEHCGLVVHCGHSLSQAVAIYEYYPIVNLRYSSNLGGEHVAQYLRKLLANRGIAVDSGVANTIKEQHCALAGEYYFDVNGNDPAMERKFQLPDGKEISLCNERMRAPEILFSPSENGLECSGIHELAHNATYADYDIRNTLRTNVIISGGSSLIENFACRLNNAMTELANRDRLIKTFALEGNPSIADFVGASILANLSTFEQMCINRNDYDEYSSSIVHRKCFGWEPTGEMPPKKK